MVNSFDEFTKLKEVIVGDNRGFSGFHFDNTFDLFYWDNVKGFLKGKNFFFRDGAYDKPVIRIEKHIMEELAEDVELLAEALSRAGVKVLRPDNNCVSDAGIVTPYWESNQTPPLNVRDNAIILGNTIVETAPHVRSRLFENDGLKYIFYSYFAEGSSWVNMPRPTLALPADSSYFELTGEEEKCLESDTSRGIGSLRTEMIFDGAQCIRLRKDVLVNVGNPSHELGYQWLKKCFGDTFSFIRLDKAADSHIDSIFIPLKPGLWLIRDRADLSFLPEKYRKWDYIETPAVEKDQFPSYEGMNISLTSTFIDMNVLSLSEDTVIVNSLYPELVRELERHHFTVIPVRHRHRRLFGGGFHCFTLDTVREGGMTAYD